MRSVFCDGTMAVTWTLCASRSCSRLSLGATIAVGPANVGTVVSKSCELCVPPGGVIALFAWPSITDPVTVTVLTLSATTCCLKVVYGMVTRFVPLDEKTLVMMMLTRSRTAKVMIHPQPIPGPRCRCPGGPLVRRGGSVGSGVVAGVSQFSVYTAMVTGSPVTRSRARPSMNQAAALMTAHRAPPGQRFMSRV